MRQRILGGIIVIDFIDMVDESHKNQVLATFKRALARDRARTTVSSISSLGLVEMTRKRTTESLERLLCRPCPTCSGMGRIKSVDAICAEIFREVMRAVRQFETGLLRSIAAREAIHRIF